MLRDEDLASKADARGDQLRSALRPLIEHTNGAVREIRGRGLLNAIVFEESDAAGAVCDAMARNKVLAKPTHGNIIRLAPPLVITGEQVSQGVDAVWRAVDEVIGA